MHESQKNCPSKAGPKQKSKQGDRRVIGNERMNEKVESIAHKMVWEGAAALDLSASMSVIE